MIPYVFGVAEPPDCPDCGFRYAKIRSDTTWYCPRCSLVFDRWAGTNP